MNIKRFLSNLCLAVVTTGLLAGIVPAGTASAGDQYIVIDPRTGPAGTQVTVQGVSFTPSVITGNTTGDIICYARSYFPDKSTLAMTTAINQWGNFETSFTVSEQPAGNHVLWVQDVSASTPTWLSAVFTVTPKLSLGSSDGCVSDNVSVRGTGFAASANVTLKFDDTVITSALANAKGTFTIASLAVPEKAGGNHTLTGKDSDNNTASCTFLIKPELTVLPAEGSIGEEIVLRGTGFLAGRDVTVRFDQSVIATNPVTIRTGDTGNFTASMTVPYYPVNSYIIDAGDGTTSDSTALAVTSGGELDRIIGPMSSRVTYNGAGFTPGRVAIVNFDDVPLEEAVVDIHGRLATSFVIPVSTGGEHTISVTDGTVTTEHVYTVLLSACIETNRNSGGIGSDLSVTGFGFVPGRIAELRYDDVLMTETEIDENGGFTTGFVIPAGTEGAHSVSVTDGINTVDHSFSVILKAALATNRDDGHIGCEVTTTGAGFVPGRVAVVSYDGSRMTEAPVGAEGTFSATFQVPMSLAGHHLISATDDINSANITFIMDPFAPPAPVLLLPANAAETESVVSFSWEGVNDPSGVTYELQVAADALFTSGNTTSIVVSKSGLVSPGYDLLSGEKLESRDEAYYWRVRAVDRASNIGEWSAVGVFRVKSPVSVWFLCSVVVEGGMFSGLCVLWFVKKKKASG